MSDPLDLLIHRHLDGTLGEEEAKSFQERLRSDSDARRRLAEMAFEHAQLREILEPAEEVASSASWSKGHLVAAASILAVVGLALFAGPFRGETPAEEHPAAAKEVEKPPPAAPKREGYQGFLGRVHARVVERRDKWMLMLKVGEVLSVRKESEAGEPGRLVGASIQIVPPRIREGDAPSPERDHAAYLAKLQPGQEVVLDLRHVEGESFAIASLTAEQAEWARSGERRKTIKETPRDVPRKTDHERDER